MCVSQSLFYGAFGDVGESPPEKDTAEGKSGIIIISYY